MHATRVAPRPFAFAGIDVGTNSVLLSILRPAADGLRVLDERCVVTRLGEGLADRGRLTTEAMERTVAVLEEFGGAVSALDAEARAAGTSALRRADNAEEFLERARGVLGFQLEVLSGAEEARLGRLGALSGLEGVTDDDGPVVVDPGGGSTEVFRDAAPPMSLELGGVRLTEAFLAADPPRSEELESLRAHVRAALAGVSAAGDTHPVVAVGGTATTLAALDAELDEYDTSVVHGHHLDAATVRGLAASLAAMPLSKRRTIPCLPQGRADIIVAGALLLAELLEALEVGACVVSDRGLRYGLVLDLIAEK